MRDFSSWGNGPRVAALRPALHLSRNAPVVGRFIQVENPQRNCAKQVEGGVNAV